jgi:hypothetical protein
MTNDEKTAAQKFEARMSPQAIPARRGSNFEFPPAERRGYPSH